MESPEVVAVVEAGRVLGLDVRPGRFAEGTRSAADAARAIGVEVGAIVKSLVLAVDGETVVAPVSRANRLNEAKLAAAAGGSSARRHDPAAVRRSPGSRSAASRPFGHRRPFRTFVDEDFPGSRSRLGGRGHARRQLRHRSRRLVRVTGGIVCDLAAR